MVHNPCLAIVLRFAHEERQIFRRLPKILRTYPAAEVAGISADMLVGCNASSFTGKACISLSLIRPVGES